MQELEKFLAEDNDKPQEEDVHGRTDDQLPQATVWPPAVGEHVVVNYDEGEEN